MRRTPVNLVSFEFDLSLADGVTFPTYFDGMMVYNNATGNTLTTGNRASTSTAVSPGFYYFSNPNGASNGTVTAGSWKAIGPNGTNIYTANGTLTGNRTISQGSNTLSFTGTSVNAFSVDGNTLSADAANHRIGIGTGLPAASLDIKARQSTGVSPVVEGLLIPSVDSRRAASMVNIPISTLIYVDSVPLYNAIGIGQNIDANGFYYFDGSFWQKITPAPATSNNGLTNSANNIQLGGNLTKPTTITNNGNTLNIAGSAATTTFASNGNVGIGNANPGTKLDINNGTSAGAIKIVDGTQGAGKFLVSDANGVGTWQNTTGSAVVINSTAGTNVSVGTSLTYTGASATVTTAGYYIFTTRIITDKLPSGCSSFLAYNLLRDYPATTYYGFAGQDAHMPAAPYDSDFVFGSNILYLPAGTYYMMARYYGASCTSYKIRAGLYNNGFTLTLLK